jgi:hypothetical protein
MSTAQIEKRLKALESEVAELKAKLKAGTEPPKKGWRAIVGSFAGDPLHAEAMRLGRKYRRSLRPKAKKR